MSAITLINGWVLAAIDGLGDQTACITKFDPANDCKASLCAQNVDIGIPAGPMVATARAIYFADQDKHVHAVPVDLDRCRPDLRRQRRI